MYANRTIIDECDNSNTSSIKVLVIITVFNSRIGRHVLPRTRYITDVTEVYSYIAPETLSLRHRVPDHGWLYI